MSFLQKRGGFDLPVSAPSRNPNARPTRDPPAQSTVPASWYPLLGMDDRDYDDDVVDKQWVSNELTFPFTVGSSMLRETQSQGMFCESWAIVFRSSGVGSSAGFWVLSSATFLGMIPIQHFKAERMIFNINPFSSLCFIRYGARLSSSRGW